MMIICILIDSIHQNGRHLIKGLLPKLLTRYMYTSSKVNFSVKSSLIKWTRMTYSHVTWT